MQCKNTYIISEEEVREIIAKHIFVKTEREVQPKAEDIKFDIRYGDYRGGTYVGGVSFTLNENIEL